MKPAIKTLKGLIANEIGSSSERRVNAILTKAQSECRLPIWFYGCTQTDKHSELDSRGVDFVISTDIGNIYLQVKSSMRNARTFKHDHKRDFIAVVVVTPDKDDDTILSLVIEEIARIKAEILKKRNARC